MYQVNKQLQPTDTGTLGTWNGGICSGFGGEWMLPRESDSYVEICSRRIEPEDENDSLAGS